MNFSKFAIVFKLKTQTVTCTLDWKVLLLLSFA